MKFPSFAYAATALAVAASVFGVPALAAPVNFSFLPAHANESVAYRYEVDETGPRGTTKLRQSLTVTRVASDRLKIVATPDTGQPTTLYALIGDDGVLHPAPLASSAPSVANGAPANGGTSSVPVDGPILGLPGGSSSGRASRGGYPGGGNSGGGYPGGSQGSAPSSARSAQPAIPRNLQILGALTTAARTESAGNFGFAAIIGEAPHSSQQYGQSQQAPLTPAAPTVQMTAHLTSPKAGESQIVADGSGPIQLALGSNDGSSSGRGGQNGGGRGGQQGGGGIGSILFPGGGGGGGRGQQGGGQRGSRSAAASVPATMNVHVESTFRNGVLEVARGKTTTTYSANGSDVTTTSTWVLSAY